MYEKHASAIMADSTKVSAYFITDGSFIEEEKLVLSMLDILVYLCLHAVSCCIPSVVMDFFLLLALKICQITQNLGCVFLHSF